MTARLFLRNRTLLEALSVQIRREVRKALHSKDGPASAQPAFVPALLKITAGALSLLLAGGAASLNQDAASVEQQSKPAVLSSDDRSELRPMALDARLKLAEQLRVMVSDNVPVPLLAGAVLYTYIEKEHLILTEERPPLVPNPVAETPITPVDLTPIADAISALSAKLDAKSSAGIESRIDGLATQIAAINGALKVNAARISDLTQMAGGKKCCDPPAPTQGPGLDAVLNAIAEINTGVNQIAANTKALVSGPAPPCSAPACGHDDVPRPASQYTFEVPENGTTGCVRIDLGSTSNGKPEPSLVRFDWMGKKVSILDCDSSNPGTRKDFFPTSVPVGSSSQGTRFLVDFEVQTSRVNLPGLNKISLSRHYFVHIFALPIAAPAAPANPGAAAATTATQVPQTSR